MRSRRPSSSADDEDTATAFPVDGGDCSAVQLLSIPPELAPKTCESDTRNKSPGPSNVLSASQLPLSAPTLGRPEKIKSESSVPLDSDKMEEARNYRRPKTRSIWACSISTFCVTLLGALAMVAIVQSLQTTQCDSPGCQMTYMRPAYAPLVNFDTEHTRFASKYKTCLYRERKYDSSSLDVCWTILLFLQGNFAERPPILTLPMEFYSPKEFPYCLFLATLGAISKSAHLLRRQRGNGPIFLAQMRLLGILGCANWISLRWTSTKT